MDKGAQGPSNTNSLLTKMLDDIGQKATKKREDEQKELSKEEIEAKRKKEEADAAEIAGMESAINKIVGVD